MSRFTGYLSPGFKLLNVSAVVVDCCFWLPGLPVEYFCGLIRFAHREEMENWPSIDLVPYAVLALMQGSLLFIFSLHVYFLLWRYMSWIRDSLLSRRV